ncbi:helix-turn-helix domain-containing protein, partial [Shewanella chilikensis]|uniref:helix-turn-helix domain-containing protein n=1 Tax=Shewanella chilikensis TaxID=558541 RepID=UPI003999877A
VCLATTEYHQQAVDLSSPFNHEWCTYYLNSGVNQAVRHSEKIPSSKKNREIVTRLFDAGIFELKDSAQVAAKRLDISVHTIYRYLRELKAPQE